MKFRIYEVEGLKYPCSENKGADQLCGYREADLRLYFRICTKAGFLMTRLISCFKKSRKKSFYNLVASVLSKDEQDRLLNLVI